MRKKVFIFVSIYLYIFILLFFVDFNKINIPFIQAQKKYVNEVNHKYIFAHKPNNLFIKYSFFNPPINTKDKEPLIVFVHGLGRDGEADTPNVLYGISCKYGFRVISPTFRVNGRDIKNKTSYQFPDLWAGNALLEILDDAKKNGLNYSKIYLFGFSGGSEFALRFANTHPDLVEAVALLGLNDSIIPESNIKYFIGVGDEEEKDRILYSDELYSALKQKKYSVIYKKYANTGHLISSEQAQDVAQFFVNVKKGLI